MIGYLCWWTVQGVRVPHADLRAALDAAGFPVTPSPPTAHTVEQRALRAWDARRRASGQSTETELEALRNSYRRMHIGIDIARLIAQIVDEQIPGAVGVRQEGGLVFAPPEALSDLTRLQALVAGLPSEERSPAFYLAALADEAGTRMALAEAVRVGLLQDIAAMERGLDHLQGKARSQRSRTMASRQEQFQVLSRRAKHHAGLLNVAQGATVQEALSLLEWRVAELERE